MSTSLDEAMRDEWERTHPHTEDAICECGATWRATFLDGDPIRDGAMNCPECGEEGWLA